MSEDLNCKDILDIEDISLLLKVSKASIRKLLIIGKIKSFKVGSIWRVKRENLMAWIIAQENEPPVVSSRKKKAA